MTLRRATTLAFRTLYNAFLLAVVVFMVFPSLVILLLSFSNDSFIRFPPQEWGFRQYTTLVSSPHWIDPLLRSLAIAVTTALIIVPIGLLAVLALHRTSLPGKGGLQFLGLAPLLVPQIAYAVALYVLFVQLGLVGKFHGLVLAHMILALPFVLLISGAAVTRVPVELELAAMSLGASQLRAWLDVTLRLLIPAIVASLIFAFVVSFDEVIMAVFLSGVGQVTLLVAIFSSVRFGVDPVITAISTLLTIVSAVLLSIYAVLRRTQ
jgi:ABC-type spermidine/putrescine transport system permease subunit II